MVVSKSDLKRRRKNSDDFIDTLSESPKRTKVHAQRKFAQSSNVSSPVITPVKEIERDKVKVTEPLPAPPEFLPQTPRPNTEDFLTFLCFRGTSILPPSLNFFNTASSVSVATQSKESTSKAVEKPEPQEKPDRPFIAFGVRKRADPFINNKLEKKRRQAMALHNLRRKYQEQHIAKLRAHAIEKMSQGVKIKKIIRTRSNVKTETKTETKTKIIPTKRIIQTTTVKVNVKRTLMKPKMCLRSRGRFIHREITAPIRPKLKRPIKVTKRDKSSSEFSSDDDQPLVKTVKPTKKIIRKIPIKREPIRITRSTPLLKRKAILKRNEKPPKVVPKPQTETNKKPSKTLSESQISQRPTRKTKEAASLYMNLLGAKLVTSPAVSDDDSIDSFPELPNVRKTEQRELEMKAKLSSAGRTTRKSSLLEKKAEPKILKKANVTKELKKSKKEVEDPKKNKEPEPPKKNKEPEAPKKNKEPEAPKKNKEPEAPKKIKEPEAPKKNKEPETPKELKVEQKTVKKPKMETKPKNEDSESKVVPNVARKQEKLLKKVPKVELGSKKVVEPKKVQNEPKKPKIETPSREDSKAEKETKKTEKNPAEKKELRSKRIIYTQRILKEPSKESEPSKEAEPLKTLKKVDNFSDSDEEPLVKLKTYKKPKKELKSPDSIKTRSKKPKVESQPFPLSDDEEKAFRGFKKPEEIISPHAILQKSLSFHTDSKILSKTCLKDLPTTSHFTARTKKLLEKVSETPKKSLEKSSIAEKLAESNKQEGSKTSIPEELSIESSSKSKKSSNFPKVLEISKTERPTSEKELNSVKKGKEKCNPEKSAIVESSKKVPERPKKADTKSPSPEESPETSRKTNVKSPVFYKSPESFKKDMKCPTSEKVPENPKKADIKTEEQPESSKNPVKAQKVPESFKKDEIKSEKLPEISKKVHVKAEKMPERSKKADIKDSISEKVPKSSKKAEVKSTISEKVPESFKKADVKVSISEKVPESSKKPEKKSISKEVLQSPKLEPENDATLEKVSEVSNISSEPLKKVLEKSKKSKAKEELEKVQSADLISKDLGRRFGKGKVNMSNEQIEKWLNDSAKEMEQKSSPETKTEATKNEKTNQVSSALPEEPTPKVDPQKPSNTQKSSEPEKSSPKPQQELTTEPQKSEPIKTNPVAAPKLPFENLKSAFEAQKSAYEAQKILEVKKTTTQLSTFVQKSSQFKKNFKQIQKDLKPAKAKENAEKSPRKPVLPKPKIEVDPSKPKIEPKPSDDKRSEKERKFIFQKRHSFVAKTEEKFNTKAFSPNNESSVYAFEDQNEFEMPLSTPFRSQFRRNSNNLTSKSEEDLSNEDKSMLKGDDGVKEDIELKNEEDQPKSEVKETNDGVSLTMSPDENNSASIAVQVNLDTSDNNVSLECSTQTDEGGGQIFYIPLQTQSKQAQSIIQGVAVKLGTEGNNQRVVMHAKLVTQNPNENNKLPSISQKPLAQNVHMCPPIGTVQPTYRLKNSDTTKSKAETKLDTTPEPPKTVPSSPSASSSSSTKITKRVAKIRKNLIPCSPSNKSEFPSLNSPGKLVEALVFRPTEQEFNDPIEFIEKIRPQAEKFGICRIIPPSNFKPECKVTDDMRFTSYNQYVHKMLKRWGPNFKELCAIKKYLVTQSVTFKHPPLIGGMEIDLPRLYQTVQSLGGLMEVIEKKRWPRVAEAMKIPKSAQDRVTKLDDIYCKFLLPYETLSPIERQKLFDEVDLDWAKHESKLLSESTSQNDPSDESDDYLEEIEAEECITKGRNMALNAFYRIARNTMSMYFKTTEPSSEEVENEFWKHVNNRQNHICVNSGSIDSGGWGYGFCCNKNSPFARHPWNLKILTNNSGSVLRSLGPVMGVTVPTLHVGMVFSACCWYRDPHGLPWIEYLHTGATKIWYGVPDTYSENFQTALKKLVPNFIQDKTLWLPSDTAMVPPNLLTQNGVSVCKTVQEPGQFVVVFPKAFTSTICTGYCVSESVYFAAKNWLGTARNVFNDIRESCESAMFSYERLLISIVSDQRSNPEVLNLILPDIEALINHEKTLRAKLEKLGLNVLERLPLPDLCGKRKKKLKEDDGEYECEICRANLFVSMVTNSHEEGIYCLDHAVEYLEQKPTQLKYCKLLFTHNLKELDGLIDKIKSNIEIKSQRKSISKYAGMATLLK